jgi:hypothetical protein
MSMMGELTFFIGIQVKQTKQSTFIHQAKYIKGMMKKFNMADLNPMSCACFQAFPRSSHRTVIQRIFRYLKYTLKFGIWYSASSSLDLVAFSDGDFWVAGLTERELLVHVIFLDLLSRKQSSIAQFTTGLSL